jgi:chromosome segregation ATPase
MHVSGGFHLATQGSDRKHVQIKEHEEHHAHTQKILKERNMLLKLENEAKVKAQEALASATEQLNATTTEATHRHAELGSSSAESGGLRTALADARRNFALLRAHYQGQTSEIETAREKTAAAVADTEALRQRLEVRFCAGRIATAEQLQQSSSCYFKRLLESGIFLSLADLAGSCMHSDACPALTSS